MNSLTQPNKGSSMDQPSIAPSQALDLLLALDRMVVELSMQLYNVQHRDRTTIRLSNRRLHASVRKHLPRFLKRSQR